MSTRDAFAELTRSILDNRREFSQQIEHIRGDKALADEDRAESIGRAYRTATAQHTQLVGAMRSLAERSDDDEDEGAGDDQKPTTLGDALRAHRDASQMDEPALIEHFLVSPPERPRELAGR